MSAPRRTSESGPDRRSVLLGGLGVGAALLSGCSLNNPYNADKTPAAEAVRDLSPDVGIAVDAVALIHLSSAAVANAVAHSPDLTASLAGFAAAYSAYLEKLVQAVPDGVDTSPGNLTGDALPTSRADALAMVRRSASTAKKDLNAMALRAESGAFARLLGSMAAGLAQQLAVLAR